MKSSVVRCRCGHQVLAKEVLRTDLYERSIGREYVYVKYRCQRCKRMGEAFVAETRWDWSMLEPDRTEMSDAERDRFLDAEAISAEDILDFHRQLSSLALLPDLTKAVENGENDAEVKDNSSVGMEALAAEVLGEAEGAETSVAELSVAELSAAEVALAEVFATEAPDELITPPAVVAELTDDSIKTNNSSRDDYAGDNTVGGNSIQDGSNPDDPEEKELS